MPLGRYIVFTGTLAEQEQSRRVGALRTTRHSGEHAAGTSFSIDAVEQTPIMGVVRRTPEPRL